MASRQSLCNPHEYWLSAEFVASGLFTVCHFVAPELMGTMMGTESGEGFQWDARPTNWDRLQQADWRRLACTSSAALQARRFRLTSAASVREAAPLMKEDLALARKRQKELEK